jgi:hypothetical protein
MDDPIELLERAVKVARSRGAEVSGWMLQSSPEAFVAWLYREDEEGLWSLFDEVEACPTALAAAQWALAEAEEL